MEVSLDSSLAEADRLSIVLTEAVKTAVAQVVPAELKRIQADVGKVACMPEKLSRLEQQNSGEQQQQQVVSAGIEEHLSVDKVDCMLVPETGVQQQEQQQVALAWTEQLNTNMNKAICMLEKLVSSLDHKTQEQKRACKDISIQVGTQVIDTPSENLADSRPLDSRPRRPAGEDRRQDMASPAMNLPPNPGLPSRIGRGRAGVPLSLASPASRVGGRVASGGTLEMVSDQLFHEIMNAGHGGDTAELDSGILRDSNVAPLAEHDPESSSNESCENSSEQGSVLQGAKAPVPEESGSPASQPEQPGESSAASASNLQGLMSPVEAGGTTVFPRQLGKAGAQVRDAPEHARQKSTVGQGLNEPNSSSGPTGVIPPHVIPSSPSGRLEALLEKPQAYASFGDVAPKRSASAASLKVQSKIIEPYLEQRSLGSFYSFFTPFVGCTLKRSRLWARMLLLTSFLFTGVRAALFAKGSTETYLVRDLAVLVFAVASGISIRQLPDARAYTESIAQWTRESLCVEDWIVTARGKQRVLLVWWGTAVMSVVSTEAVVAYQHVGFLGWQHARILDNLLWVAYEFTSLATLLVSSLLLLAVSCVQCHIISALNVFIDEWSCELCDQRDFPVGVLTWNTVQALIRRAGVSIENAFATIQGCALAGSIVIAMKMISLAADPALSLEHLATLRNITELTMTLPLLMLVVLAAVLLLQCAGITEKCAILPPLANQIMTGAIDAGRQYLVQFLNDSAAGIYVKGVKLDMLMVVNIGYFLCVALSALFGIAMRFSAG